jgi:hypothetical protein
MYERWHGTLFVIAIIAFATIFNTFLAQRLPMIERLVLIIHLLGFFAIVIPLWISAPRNSAKDVFTEFSNAGGWSSTGLSVMAGILSPIYALLGVDSAAWEGNWIDEAYCLRTDCPKHWEDWFKLLHPKEMIIASEMLDHILAGHETTAITLTYVMYELSCQPSLQSKLRAEVRTLSPRLNYPTNIPEDLFVGSAAFWPASSGA